MLSSLRRWAALLGPGLLYAGAAVGVSHLVQSTRAGAEFGFQLLGVILLVNVIKYPVFEAGPRYAAATGVTLLEGYKKIGNWAVAVYAIISILTMFIVMAAISIVTAGLFVQLVGWHIDSRHIAVLLLTISVLVLGFGQYSLLDRFMKVIIVLLTFSTFVAVLLAYLEPTVPQEELMTVFTFDDRAHVLFLVALIGWMPAPVDISIWHSVWSASKNKERGSRIPLRSALLDFKIGYWGTTLLAMGFMSLGGLVMYGSGEPMKESSIEFSGQIIQMYTQQLGQWAFPFIALAAFTTMFSTLLTCLDAFPRTLRKSTKLLIFSFQADVQKHRQLYWFWILVTALGTSVILLYFLSSMRAMVDLATTISFVIAPVFAILNYVALNDKDIPKEARQATWLRLANLGSIVVLSGFSIWFLLY